MLKIATWNVNSLRVRLPQVLEWLAKRQPDILALQETKIPDSDFPLLAINEVGYQACFAGQKTYNGVALLSKLPAEDLVKGLPGFQDPQRRVIGARYGEVSVLDLYVPNGSEVGSEQYQYKLAWLEALFGYVEELAAKQPRLVVLGDFNIAPEDRDVHDPEAWQGKVLVSEPEREGLRRLMAHGLWDSFRLFDQDSGSYSWWDYRAGAFRRNQGLRIDLILVSSALAQTCSGCHIDKELRGVQKPSDHAPVVAEFDMSIQLAP